MDGEVCKQLSGRLVALITATSEQACSYLVARDAAPCRTCRQALALLVAGGGAFAPALLAAILLGGGTALVYPTLIAAVSDAVQPVERAPAVGV